MLSVGNTDSYSNLALESSIESFKKDGAVFIKTPVDNFLGSLLKIETDNIEKMMPDKNKYTPNFLSEFEKWASINNYETSDELKQSLSYIIGKYNFPKSISSLPDSMPYNVKYEAYIISLLDEKDSLHEFMGEKQLSDSTAGYVGMLVEEMLINAIKHGNAGDLAKQVGMHAEYLRGNYRHGIMVFVWDEGAKLIKEEDTQKSIFNPVTKKLDTRRAGRGFILMNKLTDSSFVLPHYSNSNYIIISKFEGLPENLKSENLRNNYKQNHVA